MTRASARNSLGSPPPERFQDLFRPRQAPLTSLSLCKCLPWPALPSTCSSTPSWSLLCGGTCPCPRKVVSRRKMNSPDWRCPGTASGMLGASVTSTMGSPSREPRGGMGWDEGQIGTPPLLLVLILIVLSASTIPEPMTPHTGTSIPCCTVHPLHSPVPHVFQTIAASRATQ